MATYATFVCDGCDKQETAASSSSPRGWGKVHTIVQGFSTWNSVTPVTLDQVTDLCEACQHYLRTKADPRNWPRAVAEKA